MLYDVSPNVISMNPHFHVENENRWSKVCHSEIEVRDVYILARAAQCRHTSLASSTTRSPSLFSPSLSYEAEGREWDARCQLLKPNDLPLHVSSSLLHAFRTVNDCDHDICPTGDGENEKRATKARPEVCRIRFRACLESYLVRWSCGDRSCSGCGFLGAFEII